MSDLQNLGVDHILPMPTPVALNGTYGWAEDMP